MKLLIPPSRSTRRLYPCPNCQAPTAVDVVTRIESEEEITDFMARRLNRANCSFCYCPVEAPVRVVVRIPDASYLDHECIPTGMLESPEVVGEVIRMLDEGTVIVFSHDELERSIEARIRIEMYRQGFAGLESGETVALDALNTSR